MVLVTCSVGHRRRRRDSSSSVEGDRHESSGKRQEKNRAASVEKEEPDEGEIFKASSSGDVVSMSIEETKCVIHMMSLSATEV